MEVPGGNSNKLVVFLCEALGTAFLLMAVNFGGLSGNTPLVVALTVTGFAQMVGPISGGHFNPAITIAMFIKELGQPTNNVTWDYNALFAVGIILSQLVGGIIGVCIVALSVDTRKNETALSVPDINFITQLCPACGCNDGGNFLFKVFWVEMIMTFLFATLVLCIVKHNGSRDMPVNAIAIGFGLYTSISIAGPISGGCINPIVAII